MNLSSKFRNTNSRLGHYVCILMMIGFLVLLCSCGIGSTSFSSSSGGDKPVTPGNLGITLLVESIESGSSTTATVSLNNSSGITASSPVTVSILSNNPEIMNVSPQSCNLYTESNSCLVTLTGESVGIVTFSATAIGYVESTSESIAIIPANSPIIPGTLGITLLAESIESGSSTTATVSLNNSVGITASSPITVSVLSNNPAIMNVSPQSCNLYTESNSCLVTLTGESVGTTNLSVTATGYVESTSENLIITPLLLFTCVADPATGNSCGCLLQNDGSGLTWYADGSQTGLWPDWCTAGDTGCTAAGDGADMTAFNATPHCGYTDWHLASAPGGGSGGFVTTAGGEWGALGSYASVNGWIPGDSLSIWLTENGFTGMTNGNYWSSSLASSIAAYVVSMSTGTVGTNSNGRGPFPPAVTDSILLVRP